jgi:signal peptidase II
MKLNLHSQRNSFSERSTKWQLWLWVMYSTALIIGDQVSKFWIKEKFDLGTSVNINHFINIVHVQNPGAAFSFLAAAGGWQKPLLIGVAFIAIAFVIYMLLKHYRQPMFAFAMASILGGATGNVIDRFNYGAVIDFIDIHINNWHWPAFNVADIAISIGAIALILDELTRNKRKPY